jgi:outer membrane phospholipase A
MKRLLFVVVLQVSLCHGAAPDWLIASPEGRAAAGRPFELIVVSLKSEPLPEEIDVQLRSELDERIVLQLRAAGPAQNGRRSYSAVMPTGLSGAVTLELAGRSSSVLQLTVGEGPGAALPSTGRRAPGQYEPPLSENDPMYFILGRRDGWSARFQLSFKYRLFDLGTGFGRDQPWLSGFYFGYSQNSIWDLSSDSKAFRDTSYRPQFFWKWDRADEKTFVDSLRIGLEHESNGGDGTRSRSINTAFIRPEWHHALANRHEIQFAPKLYSYLEKDENPDIQQYRGHVDWQLRYDADGEWVGTVMGRRGTSGKGSFQLDLSKRARDLRFGPVGGYFHLQYFTGYGESILDYNVRRKSQLRIGFAIVP